MYPQLIPATIIIGDPAHESRPLIVIHSASYLFEFPTDFCTAGAGSQEPAVDTTACTNPPPIPKGTEITAYVNGDIPLDPTKFEVQALSGQPTPLSSAVQNSSGNEPAVSLVEVKSTPDGADITVDEKFMGDTPSTLKLVAGDHKVKLEKSGFTLTVGAGTNITVNAALDKE